MIGLDWIGFLEREKEKRDGTQVNEGEQHERTNERRHFSAFVSWSFLRRQRPESVDQKQRTESRTFPNFTAGHKGKKILRQKKDAQRHADTCICMCVCTHTHTHTHKERDLRTMSFPFFCFCARRALKITCGVQFPIIA